MLALRLAGGTEPEDRGGVVRCSPHCYTVPSGSVPGLAHTVVGAGGSWHCTCLSYCYRRGACKHISAAHAAFCPPAPAPAPAPVAVRPVRPGTCPRCGSGNSKKDGVRRNLLYVNQKYRCPGCGAYFSRNAGMGGTKIPPEAVTGAMQMAAHGMPYSGIAASLAAKGVDVCVKTVCNTVRRLSGILAGYCDQLPPSVSEVWRTDEVHLRASGRGVYLHSMIDDGTRFMLSAQMAARKGADGASAVSRAAAVLAGKIPHLTVSDSARSIHAAWEACYRPGNALQKHAAHAAAVHLDGNMNNNMMERFNREPGRYMRAARFVPERAAAAMAGRARLFHNFFHRHSGLGGRTPAEAAGILVGGRDRWATLLQNAHARKAAG